MLSTVNETDPRKASGGGGGVIGGGKGGHVSSIFALL